MHPYAALPGEFGRVFFNIGRSRARNSVRASGYFLFLGGPAFGIDALLAIFGVFKWKRAVVYSQNDDDDLLLATAFTEALTARGNDWKIALQLVETGGGDVEHLLAAESNVFVFFGGHGCFNRVSKVVAKERQEVAILCCCAPRSLFVFAACCRFRCLTRWELHDEPLVGAHPTQRHHECL